MEDEINITEVSRNDLELAQLYYEAHGEEISQSDYRVLLRLQDNPAALIKLSKDWNIKDDDDWLFSLPSS